MEALKILVVDDEPGIRSGVVRILKNHRISYPFMDDDFELILFEAASGEEAITLIEQEMPDIALLDNKLPGIQGIEVLEYIKNKQYDITVAMITSYASLDIAVKATGYGAKDFIPKPFTPQELKASIDNIGKQLFLKRITRKLKKEGKRIRYQFLSVLSHELKAPLNAIEGYLKMIQDREAGNDIESYDKLVERALTRVNGMRTLIMDLLDFTKIRFEKKKDKLKQVDIRKVAKISISTIQPYAIQKNIHIFLNAPEEVIMEVDPEDFEIIFNNLVSNAVKYNKDNGMVDIKIKEEDKNIKISVKDTGIGMEEGEISQLFREFVRIKNEKTKDIAGSGLGLSIVKKISELYDGSIKVKSKPDEGTTFSIKFPKKEVGIKEKEEINQ